MKKISEHAHTLADLTRFRECVEKALAGAPTHKEVSSEVYSKNVVPMTYALERTLRVLDALRGL